VRTDTEGLWIDGYEDGGVYYVREQAFPYLLEAAQESGNLLLSGLLGKRPSRPAIKGLPMGGIMWSGETFNDFQERHVLVQKRTPAIFLDRDGVIIEDTGYVCGSDLKFMDRIFPLIEQANSAHIPVVVVTNQSGISRGYFAEKDVEQTHAFIDRVLQEKGLRIDRFYYCPYHVKGKVEKYRKKSLCRKPDPGMVLKACRDMGLDLSASLMIGDRERDRIKLPYLDFCLFH
jgi:D,D-heptose 1,7-bisphosphate phosphatase